MPVVRRIRSDDVYAPFDAETNSAEENGKTVAPNLRTATAGFSWSLFASLVVMSLSLLTQFALGRLLSSAEFGIYAIAVSFVNVLAVFQDGGVVYWLARMSPEDFRANAGKALCLAFISGTGVCLSLAFVAVAVGKIYGEPQITQLLWIMALAFPINAYAAVGRAALQVQLRFQTLAILKIISGIVRYGLIVALAVQGFGAFSFAWPLVALAFVELACFAACVRLPVQIANLTMANVRQVFQLSRWSLSGSFCESIVRQSDYAILGLMAPAEVVGVYYFAFQLAIQPVMLLSESLRKVIVPMLAQAGGDARREGMGISYLGLIIGGIAVPGLLYLAVIAEPLVDFLWQGKWNVAVPAIQVMAIAMPFHLVSQLAEAMSQSRGEFRHWTGAVLVRGVGQTIVAATAVLWIRNCSAATYANVIASYLAVSGALEAIYLLRHCQLPWKQLAVNSFLPWLTGVGVAIGLLHMPPVLTGLDSLTQAITATVVFFSLFFLLTLASPGWRKSLRTLIEHLMGKATPELPSLAAPPDLQRGESRTRDGIPIVWLFSSVGDGKSLLYLEQLLAPLAKQFPNSRFICAQGKPLPIGDSGAAFELAPSFRIRLGRKTNAYPRHLLLISPQLIFRLRAWRPQVIVVNELLLMALYVALARPLLGRTKVLALIESAPNRPRRGLDAKLVRWIRQFVCRRIDVFLTNNPKGRDYLLSEMQVPPDRIVTSTYLVSDLRNVQERPDEALAGLLDQARGGKELIFLCVGKLTEYKGARQLIDALALVEPPIRSKIGIWWVGEGPLRSELQQLIEQKGLSGCISLMGAHPYRHLPQFYRAADVFLFPTLDDYRALVGLEALSLGMPMMHSVYDGACAEVVRDGENGFSFDPRDREATATRLTWFYVHREQLNELRQRSLELGKKFTVAAATASLNQAIQNCLDHEKRAESC